MSEELSISTTNQMEELHYGFVVSQTPIPTPKFGEGLDITHMHGTNWKGQEKRPINSNKRFKDPRCEGSRHYGCACE
jgi:hypothetical protein